MYDCILDFAVLGFVAGFCGSSGPGAYKNVTLLRLAVRRAEAGGISGLLAACLPAKWAVVPSHRECVNEKPGR